MKKIIISIISVPLLIIIILVINYIIFQNTAVQVTQGSPISPKDTIKQALLVIDIQEGTTGRYSDEDYYKLKSEDLISTINQIADSSAGYDIPVIYIKNEIHNFLINILNDTYAPGSPGSKLDARLNVVSEIILNKDKGDAFSNPALDSLLIENEINKLVITGLDLGHCINSTIMAAKNRNYHISLISDAVLAKSDSLKKVTLDEFNQSGIEVIPSSNYFENIHKQILQL
jgi:nicotinamidase-related amidase